MSAAQPDLTDAVRRTRWSELLPAHRSEAGQQPTGRPRLLDTLPLGHGRLLAVLGDDAGQVYPVPLTVSPDHHVSRARPGHGVAEALIDVLGQEGDHGDFRLAHWHSRVVTGERAVTVDQTNESVVIGDAVIVKWILVADEGPHPALALVAELESAGFTGMPRPWGALEWRGRLMAMAVEYVPAAVDGWTWAVEEILRSASADDLTPVETAGASVGDLLASFHRALASSSRPVEPGAATAWRDEAVADLERAIDVTHGAAHDLLVAHADTIGRAFATVPSGAGRTQRVHGDLHVGQVLRSGAGRYVLTDFDGNPVASRRQRLSFQPPAVDVAGMLQSFVHAGIVARRRHPELDAERIAHAAERAGGALLDAYRSGTAGLELLDGTLLRPLRLRQVLREFIYAATHLPRWSYVPEAALPPLLLEDDHEA